MIYRRVLFVSAIVAIALSVPFLGRNWNMFMHQLGAVLFLGNIVVSALWMSLARRAGHPEAFRLGVRGILLTDAAFTTPGALLLLLNGFILAPPYMQAHALWLFLGMGMFALTGVLWVVVLLPVQRRLWHLVNGMPVGGPIPAGVDALYQRWFRVGGVASLLPLIAFALMVLKPTH